MLVSNIFFLINPSFFIASNSIYSLPDIRLSVNMFLLLSPFVMLGMIFVHKIFRIPAIADHLGVFGIGQALATPVLNVAPRLTLPPTANSLVRTMLGRLKGLLAIRAAARREDHFLRGMFGPQP